MAGARQAVERTWPPHGVAGRARMARGMLCERRGTTGGECFGVRARASMAADGRERVRADEGQGGEGAERSGAKKKVFWRGVSRMVNYNVRQG